MANLTPEQWKQVSPYLDEVLPLPEEDRVVWLLAFRDREPSLAALMQTLLDEHRELEQEEFLNQSPAAGLVSKFSMGQSIGQYRLVSQIGQGGMGTVWLAERSDGRFERRVAIKFLGIALPGRATEERFKREGSFLGRLVHPHIAELIDAGVLASGEPYLVLEYIDGAQIDHFCDERKLDVHARIRLFLDVLDAVAYAHGNLIVHRDLKPSNVLVSRMGEAKLLDFGIAKLLDPEGQSGSPSVLTQESGSALTPAFAAPEQLTGGAITTATDVYGLGVLLYLLLTGSHPAGSDLDTPANLIKSVTDKEPPRASDLATSSTDAQSRATKRDASPEKLKRTLRGDLDTILAKALKKVPTERYSSVAALGDDLRRYLSHQPILSRPDTIAYRTARFVRRHRITVGLAAAAAIAVVAGVAGVLLQTREARAQRDFALQELAWAEEMGEFDNFLLTDAAPGGKPFTVDSLLDRAAHIAEREHNPNQSDHVELLLSIARKYHGQEEYDKELRLAEEAYSLSRGIPDAATRARASCSLASTLASVNKVEEADSHIEECFRELPTGTENALDRVFCLSRAREVASRSGASQKELSLMQEAEKTLAQSPVNTDAMELSLLLDLGEAYRGAGQLPQAIQQFQKANALMIELGRDETEQAGTLLNNWGLALTQLGRPLDAVAVYRRAIDLSSADQSENGVSPTLMNNYAMALKDVGRLKEAADYAERSTQTAKQIGNQVAVDQSLLERARIYRDMHELDRAQAMLDEVAPRLKKALPPGHYAFASLASEQALLELARGNVALAVQLADQSVNIMDQTVKSGGQGAWGLPLLLIRRSTITLVAGQADQAERDASRAVKLVQPYVQDGSFSSKAGRAYLAEARALHAQGKLNESREAARLAAEHLTRAIGADLPDTQAALELAGQASHP